MWTRAVGWLHIRRTAATPLPKSPQPSSLTLMTSASCWWDQVRAYLLTPEDGRKGGREEGREGEKEGGREGAQKVVEWEYVCMRTWVYGCFYYR